MRTPPYLCYWIVGDNNHGVCVRDPHIPQVPIACQQLPVLFLSYVLQTEYPSFESFIGGVQWACCNTWLPVQGTMYTCTRWWQGKMRFAHAVMQSNNVLGTYTNPIGEAFYAVIPLLLACADLHSMAESAAALCLQFTSTNSMCLMPPSPHCWQLQAQLAAACREPVEPRGTSASIRAD